MNEKQKTLTYQQAKEMKWFCENVTGLRTDFYEIADKVRYLEERIQRLQRTCELIEKFLETGKP